MIELKWEQSFSGNWDMWLNGYNVATVYPNSNSWFTWKRSGEGCENSVAGTLEDAQYMAMASPSIKD